MVALVAVSDTTLSTSVTEVPAWTTSSTVKVLLLLAVPERVMRSPATMCGSFPEAEVSVPASASNTRSPTPLTTGVILT